MGTDAGEARLLGDRYHLASPVGQDGMGTVWRAHDFLLRRNVAIKEIRPRFGESGADMHDARRRALREARSAGRLNHPAVISVHDLLEEDGRLWIVMELLEALTLKETVRHLGRLPAHWAAWIGFQLLGGLRHAHGAGVLHRDINPRNILLTGDRVVLADFGIAALHGDTSTSAVSGEGDPGTSTTVPLARTPAFVAPERLRGGPPTPAGDLWSFGASLYFAVEGRPPRLGPRAQSFLAPSSRAPDGAGHPEPAGRAGVLWPVLEGLLQRDPAARISMGQAGRMLSAVLHTEGVALAPPRLPAARLPPGAFA